MAKQIRSSDVVKRGAVGEVDVESPLEHMIRLWRDAIVVGVLLLLTVGLVILFAVIAFDGKHPHSDKAFGALNALIGGVVGYLIKQKIG